MLERGRTCGWRFRQGDCKMSHPVVLISGPELGDYGFPNGHPFGTDRYGAFMARLERSASPRSRAAGAAARDARGARVFPHAALRRPRHRAVGARQRAARCRRHAGVPRRLRGRGATSSAARSRRSPRSSRAPCGARSFRSAGCITPRATARRASACSTTAASRSRPRGASTAFAASPTSTSTRITATACSTRSSRIPTCCSRICTRTAAFSIPAPAAAAKRGAAPRVGTKLNIPMPPGADDDGVPRGVGGGRALSRATPSPELILLQCGADSLAGDPITHLRYGRSACARGAPALRARRSVSRAAACSRMGGGGYNRTNLARAWTRVVEELAG